MQTLHSQGGDGNQSSTPEVGGKCAYHLNHMNANKLSSELADHVQTVKLMFKCNYTHAISDVISDYSSNNLEFGPPQ